jgi:hypothetical protein
MRSEGMKGITTMRVLIKSSSARGVSIADEDGRIITVGDCREIVEAMRLLAPFTGCTDIESYMRWTLRSIKGAGGAAPEIEGDTPEARAESFLALLGEMGLVEFLPDQPATRPEGSPGYKGPVPIPEDVLAGIESVRQEGRTNMLDYPVVIRLAREAGHHAAADWITAHVSLYSAGLFRGFAADSTDKEG